MMADAEAPGERDDRAQPEAAPSPGGFADLATLRAAHLEMLARQTSPEGRPVLIEAVEAQNFLARAQATGAILSDPGERSVAQRIIDYWSADLLAAERGDSVDAETVTLAPYAQSATPVRRDTYSPEEARQYIRVSSVARQWRDTKSDAYLLSGDALEDARRFARDPDVANLVDASSRAERTLERRRSRNKNRVIAAMALAMVALIGMTTFAFEERRKAIEGVAEARAYAVAYADAQSQSTVELQQALERSRSLAASWQEQRVAADERLAEVESRQRLLDVAIGALADQLAKRSVDLEDIPPEVRGETIANLEARLRSGDLSISDVDPDVAAAIFGEPGLTPPDTSLPVFERPLPGFQDLAFGPDLTLSMLPALPDGLRATAYQQGALVNYLNFSLVLDTRRRTAIYAAANLDRTQRTVLSGETVYYDLDPRLPVAVQPDPGTYIDYLYTNLQIVKLVGRNDIAWGPDAGDSGLVDRLVNVYPNAVAVPAGYKPGWEAVSAWVQSDHNPAASRLVILSGPAFQTDAAIEAPPTALWKIAISAEALMQKQGAGSGSFVVDAFLVDGPHQGDDGKADPESYRTTVAEIAERTGLIFPPEVVAADRGVALVNVTQGDTLAASVPDLGDRDPARRRALTQQLVNAVRDGSVGEAEQTKVVAALVESLRNVQDLTATGRFNLLFVLSQVPSASWNRPDWLMIKASARRGVADLEAREDSRQTRIGADTRRHLDQLRTSLGLNERPTQTVYLQFADLTRERAGSLRSSLGAVGWTLPGEERVEHASRLKEVRYRHGNAADEAAARLLAADIEALGWIGMRTVPVRAVREGILEIWVGSP